jgi:chromosomal replication initiator protein
MVRRALCKTIKVALTKNLVKMQSYFIKSKWKTLMNKQPFTEQLPSANRSPMKPQNVDAPFKNLDPELKNHL